MGELIITRGYSASGKTTWAQRLVTKYPSVYVAISRDEIRSRVFGTSGKTVLDRAQETEVTKIEQEFVRSGLRTGKTVIVHDTNLVLRYAREWANIAEQEGVEFEVQDFTGLDADVEHLVWRNRKRESWNQVPEEVIRNQASKWPVSQWQEVTPKPRSLDAPPEKFVPDGNLPPAIIVDLDGTLCIKGDRDIYDASLCHLDTEDEAVSSIVHAMWMQGNDIIFLTGRGEQHREQTEQWLRSHDWLGLSHVHGPFMRPLDDRRPDFAVKTDLFNEHVRGRFNVKFALDDRDQVVKLWRDMGIKTLQVDYGNF